MNKIEKKLKVVAAALILVLMTACASFKKPSDPVYDVRSNEEVKLHYFISLSKINENPQFTKVNDTYSAGSGQHTLSVKSHLFPDRKSAEAFLLSRRTYLHQAYSTLVAPYFGVVNANPECMKMVDVSGNILKEPDSESMALSFVADESGNLMDCYSGSPSKTVKYFLKHCYKTNSVFEVKLVNRVGTANPAVNLVCD